MYRSFLKSREVFMRIKIISFLLASIFSFFLSLPIFGELNKVYVTTDGGVAVIDTQTNTLIKVVTVGNGPFGIAMNSDNRAVYVTNTADNTVSIIDTATDTVIGPPISLPGHQQPFFIALTPDGKKGYITNFSSGPIGIIAIVETQSNSTFINEMINAPAGTVSVIDTLTNTFIRQITVGVGPIAVVSSPNSKLVYVTNAIDNTISVIETSTDTVKKTLILPNGTMPSALAISLDGTKLYVTNGFPMGNAVLVIDANTGAILNQISVSADTLFIALSPTGDLAYVTSGRPNQVVSVIDISQNAVTNIIPTGGDSPLGVAFLPTNPVAYVANNESANVTAIDTNSSTVIPPLIDVIEKSFLVAAPLGILPPSHFLAHVIENKFATQTDRINHLRWTASETLSVTKYKLFRNGKFIATINAKGHKHFEFNDHNRKEGVKYVYKLVAVNATGLSSIPVKLSIKS